MLVGLTTFALIAPSRRFFRDRLIKLTFSALPDFEAAFGHCDF